MSAIDDALTAIRDGSLERLKSLLAAEPALASARDANGVSILLQAAYHRRSELVELLRAAKPSLDVFEATALGDEGRLRELLDDEPELARSWSADGFTPLHLAAFFGQPKCAELLIDRGADVSVVAKNPMSVTPLHSATASRDQTIVEMLLTHGAPVDARQQGGWTALQAAALHGEEALAGLLLAHGADPTCQSDDGKNAIELALEKGHTTLAEGLRRKAASTA